jgi:hypothetical protein
MRRVKYLFEPNSKSPFKLSRSKIDLFCECARCFWFDRRLGFVRPEFPSFTLNLAVDTLLKKEFDVLRKKRLPHALQQAAGIDCMPIGHEKLAEWRENFVGVQAIHEPTNFLIFGAIDDLWINAKDEYVVADYKATAKENELDENSIYPGYKKQMEVYQWLLRRNNLKVSDTAYFVYCNGDVNAENFSEQLKFKVKIIPYTGSDAWVENTLLEIKKCLMSERPPEANPKCEWCEYRDAERTARAEYVATKKDEIEDKKKRLF